MSTILNTGGKKAKPNSSVLGTSSTLFERRMR